MDRGPQARDLLSVLPHTVFGMTTKRSSYGSLGDRVGQEAAHAKTSVRFVEVSDQGRWLPGLLLAWARNEDGAWWGRVVWVPKFDPVEEMVPSDRLRPIPTA